MKRYLKLILLFLLAVCCLFFCFLFWASSSTLDNKEYSKLLKNNYPTTVTNDSVYSVLTYNIGYLSGMTNNRVISKPKTLFDTNLQKVLTEIKKNKPDIIALQEIDYNANRSYEVNQEEEIAKLGYNYVARGINWDKRYLPFPYWPPSMHFGKIVSGQSILSKYPINEYQRIVLERVPDSPFYRDALYLDRLAQVSKIVLDGKEVVLINIHLEAFDTATRVRQFRFIVDKLFKKYKDTYPTILLGDFNSPALGENSVVKELFSMKGIGNAVFDTQNIQNTFDTKDLYERIDYIFYTENTISYVGGRVLNEFGQASDHLPIMMNFKLK